MNNFASVYLGSSLKTGKPRAPFGAAGGKEKGGRRARAVAEVGAGTPARTVGEHREVPLEVAELLWPRTECQTSWPG